MAFLLSWSLLHSVAIKGYNATLLSLCQFHLYLLRVGCSQGLAVHSPQVKSKPPHLPGAAFIGAGRVGSANGSQNLLGELHISQ